MSLIESPTRFASRSDAASALIPLVRKYAGHPDVLVLGLARGGVPVARVVADSIHAPLDVVVARKIGVPGIEAVPLGAVADGLHQVELSDVAWFIGVPTDVVAGLRDHHMADVERRARLYRDAHPVDVRDAVVLLVDDGISTGITLRAAARAIRAQGPRRIIAVAPVATRSGCVAVRGDVDEVVVAHVVDDNVPLWSHFDDFTPVNDIDVMRLLGRSVMGRPSLFAGHPSVRLTPIGPIYDEGIERRMEISVGTATIICDLGMPDRSSDVANEEPHGLVILVGDEGRKRYDIRYVAGRLRLAGYATMRLDLLTRRESQWAASVGTPDTSQLASRLAAATTWAQARGIGGSARTIVLGVGDAAAIAAEATNDMRARIAGVIATIGAARTTLLEFLSIRVPILAILAERDDPVLDANVKALRVNVPQTRVIRIARAGAGFEEPGALGAVAEHVVRWLERLAVGHRSIVDVGREYRRRLAGL